LYCIAKNITEMLFFFNKFTKKLLTKSNIYVRFNVELKNSYEELEGFITGFGDQRLPRRLPAPTGANFYDEVVRNEDKILERGD
jgi:hypothetical protein